MKICKFICKSTLLDDSTRFNSCRLSPTTSTKEKDRHGMEHCAFYKHSRFHRWLLFITAKQVLGGRRRDENLNLKNTEMKLNFSFNFPRNIPTIPSCLAVQKGYSTV